MSFMGEDGKSKYLILDVRNIVRGAAIQWCLSFRSPSLSFMREIGKK
jgi:hypothetical protein